ncbi:MAG: alkyl hydroperoxide reductase/Thiol specific antioxidant/Mal allergen [Chthoniobacteraceae bacterium]|nr:alkyl hydroperoxide reductase/Thiol specific antioxidant/Mal allergen [Chthoniobacteraceae bacterium]
MKRSPLSFSWLSLFLAAPLCAAELAKPIPMVEPGHSMNGEAFNEGPRQAAVLMEGTGKVEFPITTSNAMAAKFFNQGVGQLHGFWYFEAERSFRQVAALDPQCAIAYWGMAMSNINNEKRAGDFIKKAVALKEKASRREQLWIDAWAAYYAENKADDRNRRGALVKALEELSFEFPDDIEAKAYLVFQVWDNKEHGIALPSRQSLDALAQQVLAVNPMHPGMNHYLIHLWNSGGSDKHAVPSAALCGQSAPAIAHMWHMPGHTFTGLKRFADAAWQQEASARVDHANMIASRILPDQIHNFAHNNAWLIQDLRYIGRVHDGVDLAKNMMELPRIGSRSGKSYELGRDELLNTLLQFELWDELAALDGTMYLAPLPAPLDDIRRRQAIGLAWLHKGDFTKAQSQLDALKKMVGECRAQRIAAADEAEKKAVKENKPEAEIAAAIGKAMRASSRQIDVATSAIAELEATRAVLDKKPEDARKILTTVTDIPSDRMARLRFDLGETDAALALARDAAKAEEQKVHPLANYIGLLWESGKQKEALAEFEKLRPLSAQLDLTVPVFARLAPLAAELKLPADWRIAASTPADSGIRPDLNTLGPFRWHPSPAPAWTLPENSWSKISLADFKGRAVLVVFYLGKGCSHCMEQLNVFGPMTKAFADAGVSIVAVSTDSPEGLHWTFEKSKEATGFSFPIVSDESLLTFKAYRAFDDFEQIPLHGIFLVDANGLVRWQDIGYEPFRDGAWLLEESKRLLSFPASKGS